MEPEQPRSLESLVHETRADVRETRADVRHLQGDVAELRQDMREVRQDIRRLDGRIDQILLVQIATLGATLASIPTVLVTTLTG